MANTFRSKVSPKDQAEWPSGDACYKDFTNIDLESFFNETLNKSPRDRRLLLRLERCMVSFIQDSKRTSRGFWQMSAYDRMLVHRLAAFCGLQHFFEHTGQRVIIHKTKITRLPPFSFKNYVKGSDTKWKKKDKEDVPVHDGFDDNPPNQSKPPQRPHALSKPDSGKAIIDTVTVHSLSKDKEVVPVHEGPDDISSYQSKPHKPHRTLSKPDSEKAKITTGSIHFWSKLEKLDIEDIPVREFPNDIPPYQSKPPIRPHTLFKPDSGKAKITTKPFFSWPKNLPGHDLDELADLKVTKVQEGKSQPLQRNSLGYFCGVLTKCFSYLKEVMSREEALAISADLYQEEDSKLSGVCFERMYRRPERRDVVDMLLKFVLRSDEAVHDLFNKFLLRHASHLFRYLDDCKLTTEDDQAIQRLEKGERLNMNHTDEVILTGALQDMREIGFITDHLLSNFGISLKDHDAINGDVSPPLNCTLLLLKACVKNAAKPLIDILLTLHKRSFVETLTSACFVKSVNDVGKEFPVRYNRGEPVVELKLKINSPIIETKLRKYLQSTEGKEQLGKALSKEMGRYEILEVFEGSVTITIQALHPTSLIAIVEMIKSETIKQFLQKAFEECDATKHISFDWNNSVINVTCPDVTEGDQSGASNVQVEITDDDSSGIPRICLTIDVCPFVDTDKEEIGTIWFSRNDIIGHGAHRSVIYKGRFSSGEEVAIKRLKRLDKNGNDHLLNHKRLIDYNHQNVVKYFTAECKGEYVFVVMELCSGSLRLYGASGGGMQLYFLEHMVNGLMFLHAKGITHGAVADSRVLIGTSPRTPTVKLGGFTSARFLRKLDGTSHSPALQAFEVAEAEHTDRKAKDVAALAHIFISIINYSLLCGNSNCCVTVQKRSYELNALIQDMHHSDKSVRPAIEMLASHPVFWPDNVRLDFLKCAFKDKPSNVDFNDAEASRISQAWTSKLTPGLQDEIVNGHRRNSHQSYDARFFIELLRAVRNLHEHRNQITPTARQELKREGYMDYWTTRFPDAVLYVHKKLYPHRNEEPFRRFYEYGNAS